MLINRTLGPRHRLAALYTSIGNLPFAEGNDSGWMRRYCESCGRCIASCPSGALYPQVRHDDRGREMHLDRDRCSRHCTASYGCGVCVRECTFNRTTDFAGLRRSLEAGSP